MLTLLVASCGVVERVLSPEDSFPHAELQKTGMLIVNSPIHCEGDVACSPRYSLRDSRFKASTPLLGEIDDEHAQLIITVRGRRKKADRRRDADHRAHGFRQCHCGEELPGTYQNKVPCVSDRAGTAIHQTNVRLQLVVG